jgi:serine/threonine-protein kinase HipA
MSERIHVAVDLEGLPVPAGVLHVETGRALNSTFVYHADYLANRAAYALDPGLPLDSGAHHAPGLPGAFADAAPDRWGRNLIRRRVGREGMNRALTDLDLLVGVSDVTRQGALRFSRELGGPYVSERADVPRLIAMPALARAADHVARDEGTLSDVKALLDAGTGSLGGARPKASVLDDEGVLHIAKFPHPQDEWDVVGWEATALDLAEQADIRVPLRRLIRFGGGAALVLARFDRAPRGRVGYLSAMSLLQGSDGDSLDYLDLAEAMALVSASPAADLRELWTRILFGTVIGNTDDHLRNHGFLRAPGGWRLSPAFDINPNPESSLHQTSIGGARSVEESIVMLRESAGDFGLSAARVADISETVKTATQPWRTVAASHGIRDGEINLMAAAIRPEVLG